MAELNHSVKIDVDTGMLRAKLDEFEAKIDELAGGIEAKRAFLLALAKAQGMFEPIERNRTVRVAMKSGGQYEFKYAELSEIIAKTRRGLSENGLSLRSRVTRDDTGLLLESILGHADGHEDIAVMGIKSDDIDDIKTLGARISYLRRYMATAQLGVASEDDIDQDGREAGDPHGYSPAPAPRPTPQPRKSASTPLQKPVEPANQPPEPVTQSGNVASMSQPPGTPEVESQSPVDGPKIQPAMVKWLRAKLDSQWTPDEADAWLGKNGGYLLATLDDLTEAQFNELRPKVIRAVE